METPGLQVGKTRWTQYSLVYLLVWVPKYRRNILMGEAEMETRRVLAECCERQGLTLLALETAQNHVHMCLSAPSRFSLAMIANLLKGYSSRARSEKYPSSNGCAERAICGRVVTTGGPLATFGQKPFAGISWNTR
jgi:putative transposase